MERNKFIFYKDWWEALSQMPAGMSRPILKAVMEYAFYSIDTKDPQIAYSIYSLIKSHIDRDTGKYDEIVEKRREAGKKGNLKRWGDTSQKSQKVAKVANASKGSQKSQMVANIANNIDIDKDKDIDIDKSIIMAKATSSADDASAAVSVNFDGFVSFFNETVRDAQVRPISKMTERRKQAVTARVREYGKQAVFDVVRKAAASSFLNGGGSSAFVADFDWLFRPNNFPKVLEGNYDNHQMTITTDNHGHDNTDNRTDQQRARDKRQADTERMVLQLLADGASGRH